MNYFHQKSGKFAKILFTWGKKRSKKSEKMMNRCLGTNITSTSEYSREITRLQHVTDPPSHTLHFLFYHLHHHILNQSDEKGKRRVSLVCLSKKMETSSCSRLKADLNSYERWILNSLHINFISLLTFRVKKVK